MACPLSIAHHHRHHDQVHLGLERRRLHAGGHLGCILTGRGWRRSGRRCGCRRLPGGALRAQHGAPGPNQHQALQQRPHVLTASHCLPLLKRKIPRKRPQWVPQGPGFGWVAGIGSFPTPISRIAAYAPAPPPPLFGAFLPPPLLPPPPFLALPLLGSLRGGIHQRRRQHDAE